MNKRRAAQTALAPQVGDVVNASRFTVNLSGEVGDQLRQVAYEHRVSESSIIEIAVRQLFRRVPGETLGAFLRDHGACLRRRS